VNGKWKKRYKLPKPRPIEHKGESILPDEWNDPLVALQERCSAYFDFFFFFLFVALSTQQIDHSMGSGFSRAAGRF
jgi:hypothetical protein